ncbi:glycerophosphodiester phosphodiesterase [Novibacillus thermophilus]|jgi:glycerophosphoryl diester phosphodiesterase
MKILAHRGSSGTHPENTMPAFEEAYRAGADGIELDVQMTKDGALVIVHDAKVDRTSNGTGWVKDFTLDEIKELDFGGWFSEEFSGLRIPTLEEVLDWISGTSLELNIELKNGAVRHAGLEDGVVRLVRQYRMEERVILSSFNHYSLVDVHRNYSDVETAILFMEGLYEPWHYARSIGANGLHCYLPVAVPEFLQGAQQNGMPVRPFTVNKAAHIRRFKDAGCAGIFTDFPERAVKIRDESSVG